MDVFDLAAKITLNDKEFSEGLDGAKAAASKFAGAIGTTFKAVGASMAAITAGVAAITGAIIKGTGEVAAYGDNIDKMSQKLGISAEAYQEWDAVLQHSGTSIDGMQRGMMSLASAAEKGSDAFQRIGISQKDLESMSQEELFSSVITGLQGMEEGSERAVLAQQLLGGAAKELGPLLNTSAEDTQAMKERVHELGGVMSDEAVKAAAAYQDSLQDMNTAVDGAKRGLLGEFMPALTEVMNGLTEIFSGGDGLSQISTGLKKFADKLGELIPRVIKVGSQIVMALTEAIISNLPSLLSSGADAVIMLTTGIIEQLPAIIDVALQLIQTLADGLIANLPIIISTIVDVVLAITDKLTDAETVSQLIVAAVQIIVALVTGITQAIPRLIAATPQIISGIVDGLKKAWPDIKQAGIDILKQLVTGIGDTLEELIVAAAEIIQTLKQAISDAWTEIKDIGKKIIDGIWQGLIDAWGAVKEWFSGVVGRLSGTAHVNIEKNEGPGKAIGMDYVPYNGYAATLHRGEAVLTRSEAAAWRNGQGGGNGRIVNINISTTDLDQSKIDYIIHRANQELGGALA